MTRASARKDATQFIPVSSPRSLQRAETEQTPPAVDTGMRRVLLGHSSIQTPQRLAQLTGAGQAVVEETGALWVTCRRLTPHPLCGLFLE